MQQQKRLPRLVRWDIDYIAMLYADESVLRLQGMKTLEELINEALAREGMTASELGKRLGYVNGYQGFHDLFISKRTKFTRKRQEQVAEILNLPKDHFEAPEKTEARRAYIRQQFEEFLQTDIAKEIDEETLRTIERIPFTGSRLPTKLLYQHIALAMKGTYSMAQVDDALRLNEMVDSHPQPRPKPSSPKRRK